MGKMKGQVSAEMLILLAVVVAIVALAATYLMNVGKSTGESVQNQSADLTARMDFASKGDPGDTCDPNKHGSDCKSGSCGTNTAYKCD